MFIRVYVYNSSLHLKNIDSHFIQPDSLKFNKP